MLGELLTPQPRYVPGYTGYCPQYSFRTSNTYGALTHKLLIDPCTNHAEKIILSSQNPDENCIQRPTAKEISLVKAHENAGDPIYKYPTIPGYNGFTPFFKDKIGARFAITSTEGIAEFQELMLKNKCEAKKLKHRIALQEHNLFRKSLGERSLEGGDYRMPLIPVRRESKAVLKINVTSKSTKSSEYSKHYPPHFMEKDDPQKYIISGFAGSIPYEWRLFGQANKPLTNSALCDFFRDYNHKQTIEWTPVTNNTIGRTIDSNRNFEIYVRSGGLIPSYAGHVPGESYTGFCPQYTYRTSDSYGTLTHKLLIDPHKTHVESLILSTRADDEYRVERPTLREIDLVKAHEKATEPIYKFPTIPGYEGFIPFINNVIGSRYAITSAEGISEIEKRNLKDKCGAKKLKHRSAIEDTKVFNKSLGETSFEEDDYRLPTSAVRPDVIDIPNKGNNQDIPPPPPQPYSKNNSPTNDGLSAIQVISGFAGGSPFTWPRFGQGDKPIKNSVICNFVNDYHHRRSAEWAPVINAGIGATKPFSENIEIYVKHGGIIPNYAGHVPGEKFSFGKTYAVATIDAKRFLGT